MKLGYSPALDGLRAVAILTVMAFHAGVPFLPGANLGVDLFFVLSGYLVGRLLLAEYEANGRIVVKAFYKRRLWRLLPALVALLVMYLLLAPFLWPDYWFHLRDALAVLLYVPDIALMFGHGPHYLLHSWSLGVEERFYLLAPWLLLGALVCFRRRYLWCGVVVLLLGVWVWEWYCLASYRTEHYYRFDIRVSGLLVGMLLASLGRLQLTPSVKMGGWLAFGLTSLWLTLLAISTPQAWRLGVGGLAVEMGAMVAIVWVVSQPDGVLAQALSGRAWVYIGKISYGLYLFHYPVMQYLKMHVSWPWVWLLGSLIALILAVISWHFLEQPINNWRKNRYSMQPLAQ